MKTLDQELDAIAWRAHEAALALAQTTPRERSVWLRAIAHGLDAQRDELVTQADEETHLGHARLDGELNRTMNQLRLFADAIIEGSYLEATIDHANPGAVPPHTDLRRTLYPLGPVAVFAASNFPFAFSVAGGDTASALAAGCPVIVKAHPAHERLSKVTAEIILQVLSRCNAPTGTFSVVYGHEAGIRLVAHPALRAVGFTGSVNGGRALFDRVCSRPDPIPFYGELGSINPVVITSSACARRGQELARGLAGSFTMGVGQFCTKPGVVFVPQGTDFEQHVATAMSDVEPGLMLTPRIAEAFHSRVDELCDSHLVDVISRSAASQPNYQSPVLLGVAATDIGEHAGLLLEECFGPVTVLVRYNDQEELLSALRCVPGSLTATLHCEESDDVTDILGIVTERAGRILFEGWPTGVAVTWSQTHGGPWPATTSIHTSVGVTALRRFLRPVTYQDAPESVLPLSLREGNPLGIPRRVDGILVVPNCEPFA